MNKVLFYVILLVGIFSLTLFSNITAQSAGKEMNLHDFMEDFTEVALKKAKNSGDIKYLERVYKEIPNLALPEAKEKWTEITSKAIAGKDYDSFKKSCKACHKEYKKPYKKTYRKRQITIPSDLIQLFKDI